MSVIERASVCTFDGPDTCSLSVTVEDGRITKVRGSEATPFTAAVICKKVAHPISAAPYRAEGLWHLRARDVGRSAERNPLRGPAR